MCMTSFPFGFFLHLAADMVSANFLYGERRRSFLHSLQQGHDVVGLGPAGLISAVFGLPDVDHDSPPPQLRAAVQGNQADFAFGVFLPK